MLTFGFSSDVRMHLASRGICGRGSGDCCKLEFAEDVGSRLKEGLDCCVAERGEKNPLLWGLSVGSKGGSFVDCAREPVRTSVS